MRDLLAAPGDPFARDHYRPGHLTASAFVLSPRRDQLLLVFHRKLGRWLQPGGHIEPDDQHAEAAARREVLEEVGLADLLLQHDGIFDLDVHDIPALGNEPAHEHHDVRFLFRAGTEPARVATDAHEHRWADLAQLADIAADDSILRAVRKIGFLR